MKREIREKTGYKNRDFVFKNYVWGIRFYSEDNMKMVKDFVCFRLEVTRCTRGFPCSSAELACRCRRYKKHGFNTWVRKIPWWWAWQLTPVFLPGESPWMGGPGRLQSMGSQRVQTWLSDFHTHTRVCSIAISVMLTFMGQLDWAIRYPDVGPNIILGVSARVFLDEIYIWDGRLDKADHPPWCGCK